VIPKLVGISRRGSEGVGWPPSPSKNVIVGLVAGRVLCLRTRGDGMLAGSRDGVGEGKQKSTFSTHKWKDIVPVCISITALIVAINGLPRIMETWEFSYISMTMKSQGMKN